MKLRKGGKQVAGPEEHSADQSCLAWTQFRHAIKARCIGSLWVNGTDVI
jgi:hypothetical protein